MPCRLRGRKESRIVCRDISACAGIGERGFRMREAVRKLKRKTAVCILVLAAAAAVCGCRTASDPSAASNGQAEYAESEMRTEKNDFYEAYQREPYAVRTVLREYAAVNPDTGNGAYGRYTELTVEGKAPDTFREAVAECNRRAEESVRTRVDRIAAEQAVPAGSAEGYRFVTCGYIASVTRADRTAFSILETEFEKGARSGSEAAYRFRGTTRDTQSGAEIALEDLAGGEEWRSGMLREALLTRYGIADLAGTASPDYAWTADALGIRFYFHSDAVSAEKNREVSGYPDRAVTAALPYDSLPGPKAKALASVPDSYIAMLDRETAYRLPHGNLSILLTQKDGATVIRIRRDGGEPEDLIIEYADKLSDFYIIRSEGGFYLFRERIGYQEGFFYDFSRPDGGFGRFAYNPSQYFDSFLREIQLAVPYNPYCAHMAEVRRSFGKSSYDRCSFIPHGHYTFPSDPGARYKRFVLADGSLQIDSNNTACRLLEDLPAAELGPEGEMTGEITVPAGQSLVFEAVHGEAPRYDDPPRRSQWHSYRYDCRLADGRRICFESSTESTVSTEKGYLNRFTEPVSLWEAQFAEPAQPREAYTVQIGGRVYPLIPDYSLDSHTGEEIDFGEDLWWQVEGYPGRYAMTEEDRKDLENSYFSPGAFSDSGRSAELVITEDGQAVLDCFGEVFRGKLPEKRRYKTNVDVFMESGAQYRTFQIILREGKSHSRPGRIELYSQGLPATNEPSHVPPITVYLTRVPD